jgi:hypothetical protein
LKSEELESSEKTEHDDCFLCLGVVLHIHLVARIQSNDLLSIVKIPKHVEGEVEDEGDEYDSSRA